MPHERDDAITLLVAIQKDVHGLRFEAGVQSALMKFAIEGLEERMGNLEGAVADHDRLIDVHQVAIEYHSKELKKLIKENNQAIKKLKEENLEAKRTTSNSDWKHESDVAATIEHMQKVEKSFLKMALEFKKDPMVIGAATIVTLAIISLAAFHIIQWYIAGAFILTSGLMPAIVGRKNSAAAKALMNVKKDENNES